MNEKFVYYSIAIILLGVSFFVVYKTLTMDLFSQFDSNSIQSISKIASDKEIDRIKNLPVITINDNKIYVEIADNNESRAQGLSGREYLHEFEGMLFLYEFPNRPGFWMYDMNFDLDMIWINNGVVVDITENVPAPEPGTHPSDLPRYFPSQNVDAILEVNAGFAAKHNIQVGDSVILPEQPKN